jgi:phosphoribosylglycinamide formyltransferase-1
VIGVLVSGEGTNLQALIDEGLPIGAVASNKTGAGALDRATAVEIPTRVFELEDYESREERDGAMAEWLAGQGVQLVVCAGYMHLLRPTFLERFPGRIVNTHSAPLPDFPGAHPIEDVLAAGAKETAATVHYVNEGVDSGPVIATESVPVREDDTVETLRERVKAVEHRLLPKAVRELIFSVSWGAAGGAGPEGTVLHSPGPERPGPPAASGGGGAGLRPGGADAGQGGEEEISSRTALGSRRCSTAWTRSRSVSTVSSSRTGTRSAAITGPVSTPSST